MRLNSTFEFFVKLDRNLNHSTVFYLTCDKIIDIALICAYACAQVLNFEFNPYPTTRNLEFVFSLASKRDNILSDISNLSVDDNLYIANTRYSKRKNNVLYHHRKRLLFSDYLYIAINLLVLKFRKEQSYPVYEGLRIVKEHIS